MQGIKCTALQQADGSYLLNGSKTFITNGVRADFLVCAVKTTEEGGHAGISFLILEREMPGYEVVTKLEKMGWRSSDTAELSFEDVRALAHPVLRHRIILNFNAEAEGVKPDEYLIIKNGILKLSISPFVQPIVIGGLIVAMLYLAGRLIQPAFHAKSVRRFGSLIVRQAQLMLDRWDRADGHTIDVDREMMGLTLAIVGEAMFGIALAGHTKRVDEAFSSFNAALARERLHLRSEARTAWQAVQRLGPDSAWAAEADRHITALSTETLGQVSVDLENTIVDPAAIALVPKDMARRFHVLPVSYDADKKLLLIAVSDPANVVALDQPFFYNRLGAFNPGGMIYALRRDVVVKSGANEGKTLAELSTQAAAGEIGKTAGANRALRMKQLGQFHRALHGAIGNH